MIAYSALNVKDIYAQFLTTFSYFDSGNGTSEKEESQSDSLMQNLQANSAQPPFGGTAETEPERFYHGFVLGLMVDKANDYVVKSNRESGFG